MKAPRGTYDLFFEEAQQHSFVLDASKKMALLYGFSEVITPIFEHIEVFQKTLGDSSDIISKEMYVFEDRNSSKFVLRPEGTAGVSRAFINANLSRSLPVKLFYSGPMFRYERPQKGRFRQFYQLGVEFLGLESPLADAEVILLGQKIINNLKLKDKVSLEINSIGDTESRSKYQKELVSFLNDNKSSLSEHSLKRLEQNPLRILDSKDEADKNLLIKAPKIIDSLNALSLEKYAELLEILDGLGVSYKKNDFLVRGLDYYNHCVFEFTSQHLGAQSAVIAGGRYDNLIQKMGGPSVSGVGWGAGVERIKLLMSHTNNNQKLVAIIVDESVEKTKALQLAEKLRNKNIAAEIIYTGNLSKKIKKAQRINASQAVIIGSEENSNKQIILKDFESCTQKTISESELLSELLKN